MAWATLHEATRRGTRAIQRLVEFAPATGGLALWVRHEDRDDREDDGSGVAAPPVSTDGRTLFYSPGFDELPLDEQAGHVAHGTMHIALRHAQRFGELQRRTGGEADLVLFNACADAIVNSSLAAAGWLKLPAGAVRLETLLACLPADEPGAHDAERALLEWDVERLYRAIDDRKPSRGGRRAGKGDGSSSAATSERRDDASKGRGRGDREASERRDADASSAGPRLDDGPRAAHVRKLGSAAGVDLRPEGDPMAASEAPEQAAASAREWAARLERAHADDGAFSMLRGLIADLPRPRTPWEQVLRTLVARHLRAKPTLSWSRPSRSWIANQGRAGPQRRMPWEPGRSATQPVPRLVLVVDVSGSIDAGTLERFSAEIESVTHLHQAGLTLVIGDYLVRHVQPFDAGKASLTGIRFDGGGGTDFEPLLEEARKHRPDLAIVLTDLDGHVGARPAFPVVWAVPGSCADAEAPFGRLLVLDDDPIGAARRRRPARLAT